jgi:hypothetical protein
MAPLARGGAKPDQSPKRVRGGLGYGKNFEGASCADPVDHAQEVPGQVVLPGPRNAATEYRALPSNAAPASSDPAALIASAPQTG